MPQLIPRARVSHDNGFGVPEGDDEAGAEQHDQRGACRLEAIGEIGEGIHLYSLIGVDCRTRQHGGGRPQGQDTRSLSE